MDDCQQSTAVLDSSPATADDVPPSPWLTVTSSAGLSRWLGEQAVSLACTTYQTGKLLLIGRKPNGKLAVHERNFTRSMGLCGHSQSLLLSTEFQLWRLENILRPGELYQDHDRLYVPKMGITTGDLDIHDVAIEADGRVVFAATGLNCVGTVDDRYSFKPLWTPPFISKLAAEDRCHLNGLALQAGKCKYVTVVGASDEHDGWRNHRRDGGLVIDVETGETVAKGLSMPHSPRVHEGELYLLNSGIGRLGKIDRTNGTFTGIASSRGYLRGLSFVGKHFAVVGLSRPRHDKTFGGLQLDEVLAERGETAECGLDVIDLRSGETIHWVRFEGIVTELYDVAALAGPSRPMAFGFKADEIRRIIAPADFGTL